MNGIVAMLGEVKDNLNSESFKSSLAKVFQSVGLAFIISTTHPDAPLPLFWVCTFVEGFGSNSSRNRQTKLKKSGASEILNQLEVYP
jgi:hypothetical protein